VEEITVSDTPANNQGTTTTIVAVTRGGQGTQGTQSTPGETTIADGVVASIAGLAAREVTGVSDMTSAGLSQAFGNLGGFFTGNPDQPNKGVAVEIGETECIVDLNIIVEYGASVPQVADTIRRNVIERVKTLTGLDAREVNINVADIILPSSS